MKVHKEQIDSSPRCNTGPGTIGSLARAGNRCVRRLVRSVRCPMRHLVATLLVAVLIGCRGESGKQQANDPTLDSATQADPEATNRGWVRIKPRGESSDSRQLQAEIQRLQTLGYVSGSEIPLDGLVGVTVHHAERTTPGLNIVISGHGHEASLMDASGKILHQWQKNIEEVFPGRETAATHFRRAHLFPNGDLLVLYSRAEGMVKLDRKSNVLWATDNKAHHDFEVQPNGDIYVLARTAHIIPHIDPEKPTLEDYVVVLDPAGNEKRRVSLLTALMHSDFKELWANRKKRTGDVFHTNSLHVCREQHDIQIEPFRDNRVLLSILRLNLIALLDMDREQIVWTFAGDFKLQHDAQLLANSHLLLFDNRGLGERSRILEFDVATRKTVWEHPGDRHQSFYSKTRGLVQRFRNGNTLITETDSGRAFEVSPAGEIVWEFYNPQRAGSDSEFIAALLAMLRLPPDFPTDWMIPPSES